MSKQTVKTKAKSVLKEVRAIAKTTDSMVEFNNRVFGPGGVAAKPFLSKSERIEFGKTDEFKEIVRIQDEIAENDESVKTGSGKMNIRLPKSVHTALLRESESEGVSLNQLCVTKLVAQLKAVL